MLTDFRRQSVVLHESVISQLSIDSLATESVHNYKYLGNVFDHKLTFNDNSTDHVATIVLSMQTIISILALFLTISSHSTTTQTLSSKSAKREGFLWNLRNMDMTNDELKSFYPCYIKSVLTFSFCFVVSWDKLSRTKNKLKKVVNASSKAVGRRLCSLSELYEWRVKLQRVWRLSLWPHIIVTIWNLTIWKMLSCPTIQNRMRPVTCVCVCMRESLWACSRMDVRGWSVSITCLIIMPHLSFTTLASACKTVVAFDSIIISDATNEFLSGDNKESLNWTEIVHYTYWYALPSNAQLPVQMFTKYTLPSNV